MTSEQRYRLRHNMPLLRYLEQQGWKPAAYSDSDEVCGRCPLHRDSRPSFYVNRRKDVFYCHGCGRGGDVIRLVELLHGLKFADAVALLTRPQAADGPALWNDACNFYQHQLAVHLEAQGYLRGRGIDSPELIRRMRIGYAPGGCLRAYLQDLGYSREAITASGFTDAQGRDRFFRAITFPIAESASMYGRRIDAGGVGHRFLPRPKGGLWGWDQVPSGPTVIVVEGLFDLASLWQAGFDHAVALLGSHFQRRQLEQLCDEPLRSVYLCLDADVNGSGPRAAELWRRRCREHGLPVFAVQLPPGYDPNRFFAEGGTAAEFAGLLAEASR